MSSGQTVGVWTIEKFRPTSSPDGRGKESCVEVEGVGWTGKRQEKGLRGRVTRWGEGRDTTRRDLIPVRVQSD